MMKSIAQKNKAVSECIGISERLNLRRLTFFALPNIAGHHQRAVKNIWIHLVLIILISMLPLSV